MLDITNLSVTRAGRTLLSGLTLRADAGEILWLEGANGLGKTTLIKTIAGLLRPTVGTVTWHGEPVRGNDAYREALLYIGHADAVKPELSVWRNLAFWAGMQEGGTLTVPAAMHYFDLEPFAEMPVGSLSAGWQRKVALARLLTSQATLWLLDEPFAHLDLPSQGNVAELIRMRADKGGIVLFTAHGIADWPEVRRVGLEGYVTPTPLQFEH